MTIKAKLDDSDLHPHLEARMRQRGITRAEIEETLNHGWPAGDAKSGTFGKAFVFSYKGDWEGKHFDEKEVTVYYKFADDKCVLLTAKARYGKSFSRRR
ncbi:MAG: DUF4258 domain-containing protein [Dehalococcoidia bacterium]